MGTLSTAAQKLQWDVNSTITNAKNRFSDLCDSIKGRFRAIQGSVLNGDVVGINVDEIDNMRQAIRDYVNALEKHLQQVKTDADNTNAMRGDYATEVRGFIEAVCETCEEVISYLLAFSDKLVEVKEAYAKKDETMASDIRTQAGDLRSSQEKYTEQK